MRKGRREGWGSEGEEGGWCSEGDGREELRRRGGREGGAVMKRVGQIVRR